MWRNRREYSKFFVSGILVFFQCPTDFGTAESLPHQKTGGTAAETGGDKDKKDDQGKKDNKPGDQGQPKPMPGGISKQRLENLLDAVNNEEKKIQEKVNAQKAKGKPVQTEKDW